MSLDESILSHVLRKPSVFVQLQRAGVTEDYFVDEFEKIWTYMSRVRSKHGKVPSASVIQSRYPDLELVRVRDRDLPILLHDLQQRKKYMNFIDYLDEAAQMATDPDEIDVVMSKLQNDLNSLSIRNGDSALVDLFASKTNKRMLKDLKRRKDLSVLGIPTGLKRFDAITGGLQPGRMVTIIARPSIGKSWLDLLFVASATMHGSKVILYPLEMTLEDTALRLYSIFSCRMFSPSKALRNLDLANGRVSISKVAKFTSLLEDKYAGSLYVADIAKLSDSYTMDRIAAEAEIYQPHLQWIDYLTLMKAPGVGRNGQEDYTTIKALSNGGKQIATRYGHVMGISAQVNRDAIHGKAFLPRLENISYGDSIGQDADHVLALNRKDHDLYYALIKNRHGPETGKIRVKFAVDHGQIQEYEKQTDDDE